MEANERICNVFGIAGACRRHATAPTEHIQQLSSYFNCGNRFIRKQLASPAADSVTRISAGDNIGAIRFSTYEHISLGRALVVYLLKKIN
jgi:hypothetical protein